MSNITDALPISKKDIMSLLNSFIPKGMIAWFDLDEPPDGWEVCDGTNGTPNLIGRYPLGATSGIGSTVAAGLPNIGGSFYTSRRAGSAGADGAFAEAGSSSVNYWAYNNMATESKTFPISFSAALSNSIYGNSDTVTPPSVKLLPCRKK